MKFRGAFQRRFRDGKRQRTGSLIRTPAYLKANLCKFNNICIICPCIWPDHSQIHSSFLILILAKKGIEQRAHSSNSSEMTANDKLVQWPLLAEPPVDITSSKRPFGNFGIATDCSLAVAHRPGTGRRAALSTKLWPRRRRSFDTSMPR
jgi:hypothetical protein